MSLRERFALHRRTGAGPSTDPATPAEPGRASDLDMSGETAAPAPTQLSAGTGPAERLVRAPELRARGTAYGHGVYRLFVHGRTPRKPFELPRVSGVDPSILAAIPAPAPTRTVPAPVSHEAPRLRPSPPQVEPARDRSLSEMTPDPLALGPDQGGYLRRVVLFPHALTTRPPLLGGALARLELPNLGACQAMLPRLLARPLDRQLGHPPLVFLDVETTALDRGAGGAGLHDRPRGARRRRRAGRAVDLDAAVCEAAMLADLLERLTALAGPRGGGAGPQQLQRRELRRPAAAHAPAPAAGAPAAVALERPHLDLLPPARRMWRGATGTAASSPSSARSSGCAASTTSRGTRSPPCSGPGCAARTTPRSRPSCVASRTTTSPTSSPCLPSPRRCTRCITAPPDLDAAVRAAEHHLVTPGAAARPWPCSALAVRGEPPGAPPAQRRRALLLTAELLRRDGLPRPRRPALGRGVPDLPRGPGRPRGPRQAPRASHRRPRRALEVARSSAAPCPRRLARLQRKLIARLPAAAAPRA
jgi:hypothetical protein